MGIKLRYWNSSSFSGQQRETDTSRGWGQSFLVVVSQHRQYRSSRLVSKLRPSFKALKTWKRVPLEAVLELLSVQGYSKISTSALAYMHCYTVHECSCLKCKCQVKVKDCKYQTPGLGSPRHQCGDILHACSVYLCVCMWGYCQVCMLSAMVSACFSIFSEE